MDLHRSPSSSSSGSYGRVGTPLAFTPESGAVERRIRGRQGQAQRFVPVWKQEVTDEQGRKRLHGAFKGGFSAGYYNTVGSKEGWQPSTFESSRSTRSERKTMRPEDFMDKEDLEEALDGKQLRAAQPQRRSDQREPRTGHTQPEDLLGLLIPAVQSESGDSPGHRLLRRLGFRSAPATSLATALSFIPPTKRDRHGLGYSSSTHASIIRPSSDLAASSSSSRKRPPLGIRGGIGVGILNEDDMDEDVAVYSDQEDDDDDLAGRRALPRLSKKHSTDLDSRPYDIPIGATDVCSDGMRAIPGFIVCARGVVLGVTAATVQVPGGWRPNPPIAKLPPPGPAVGVRSLPPGMVLPLMPPLPVASLPPMPPPPLGFPFPPPPLLPTGMPSLPIPPPPPLPFMASAAPPRPNIKTVPKEIALAALNAPHKPFTGDKRDRFLAYCDYCAGNSTHLPFLSDADQSEFASTASLFRPMSAMLEARFTRAHVQVGDSTPAGSDPAPTATTAAGNPAESAAAMSMFGAMTRTTTDFFPARLVCKRFGVPPPHGKHNAAGSGPSAGETGAEVDEHLNEATMQSILEGARGANPFKFDARASNTPAPAQASSAWVDPLASMPRPPQEVFDKIFGDAVARLAQCALGPALDVEDMPQVEVGEEEQIAADAVARVLAMHQLEDAGIAVPPTLRVKGATGEDKGKAETGEYERVDERDSVVGTAAVGAAFKPRLFKRKRATEADQEDEKGVKGTGGSAGGEVKKVKKRKVGAATTTLSFGDDF